MADKPMLKGKEKLRKLILKSSESQEKLRKRVQKITKTGPREADKIILDVRIKSHGNNLDKKLKKRRKG